MTILLLIVGVLIAAAGGMALLVSFSSKPAIAMDDPKSLPGGGVDVLTASITDVRKGGLISASAFGESFESADLEIDEYHRMTAGDEVWQELVTEFKGKRVAIESRTGGTGDGVFQVLVHRDEDLSKVGLEASALDSLGEGLTLQWGGQAHTWKRSGEAHHHRGGEGFGKAFTYHELWSEDGGFIRIELRKGADPVVSVARPSKADDYSVLRVRAKGPRGV